MAAIVLLLGLGSCGAAAPRWPGAIETAYYDFRPRPDGDFVRPDDWTRTIAEGYPHFVEAVLSAEEAAVSTRSLVFRLNGGSAAYYTPYLPASADFEYVVSAQVKTKGLVQDKAFVLLEFRDELQGMVGAPIVSEVVGGTEDWTILRLGPIGPPSPKTRFLRLACVTQPGKDLSGSVHFDDLWIGRLPRMHVETSGSHRVFEISEPKEVTVGVTGIEGRRVDLTMELKDEEGGPLGVKNAALFEQEGKGRPTEWSLPIEDVGFFHLELSLHEGGRRIMVRDYPVTVVPPSAARAAGEFGLSTGQPPDDLAHCEYLLRHSGSRWLKLPFWERWDQWERARLAEDPDGGRQLPAFLERLERRDHRVVGMLESPSEVVREQFSPRRAIGMADVFSLPVANWRRSLERVLVRRGLRVAYWQLGGDQDLSFEGVSELDSATRMIEKEMSRIAHDVRLGFPWSWMSQVPADSEVVSFLSYTDEPPADRPDPADTLRYWTPIGDDELFQYLVEVRKRVAGQRLFRFLTKNRAEGVRFLQSRGIPLQTRGDETLLPASDRELVRLLEAGVPPLTAEDLEQILQTLEAGAPAAGAANPVPAEPVPAGPVLAVPVARTPQIWVQLLPLAASRYDRRDRIVDLSRRLLAAKAAKADGIFASRFLDPEHGLADADGAPTELFTIWRTIAEHLANAEYLGTLSLPDRTINRVFLRDGKAVVALWRDGRPGEVDVVVGDDAKRTDLWGRSASFEDRDVTRRVDVGQVPVFLIDASEPLVRFQMAVEFERGRLPSEIGLHRDRIKIRNTFSHPLAGKLKIGFPEEWNQDPEEIELDIPPGRTAERDVLVTIPLGAIAGERLVPLDFEIDTDRKYRFRIHRPYHLGMDEIQTLTSTRLLDNGLLEVRFEVTNQTQAPMSLQAEVRGFERLREGDFIQRLLPGERTTRQIYLPRGSGLIGQTLLLTLRGGRRQFSYEIPVEP